MVKQERAARTQCSLIRAAAEVFAEAGFAPVSLTAVSRRAGVSNGALHFHFATKQALAQAVEDAAARTVRQITADAAGEDATLQGLVDATHELISRSARDVVVRAGFGLSRDPQGAGSPRLEWQHWVEGVLRSAQKKGQLAAGVSAAGAARTIAAATFGFEVLGVTDRSWLSEERITGFWDLVLPGLAQQDAPAPVSSRFTGCAGGAGRPSPWSCPQEPE
ncbi:ScbR family autoregulator-binding transcription factor [Kitasatospora sp. NBC_01266]|jgi:AcrR family transcriptional regulator|uniref:ScbR family autoregulator-binding transcription factor n=1 Tax=Kitasatospora sp. NBC_01266 TaxID=2903572 RepID=UPI002E2FFBD9|nr:ScbR family autoregulator-binding transcription factor [Kitasatospora sp. NBC_01266]